MKYLNSPIVITIIVVVSAFVLSSQSRPNLAEQARGLYDEIIDIAEEGSNDAEKTEAIQAFATQIAAQLREGFSEGFSSKDDSDEESADQKFLRIKKEIEVFDVREVKGSSSNRREFLFSVKNKSDEHVKSIRVNFDFYREGKLIDTESKWLSEIRVLESGVTVNQKGNKNIPRELTEAEKVEYTFDEIKAVVTSFQIVE